MPKRRCRENGWAFSKRSRPRWHARDICSIRKWRLAGETTTRILSTPRPLHLRWSYPPCPFTAATTSSARLVSFPRARRRLDRAARRYDESASRTDYRAGRPLSASGYLRIPQSRRGGRPDVLRCRRRRAVSACGELCGSDSQRRQACRPSRSAAGEIRVCAQSEDGQNSRHPDSARRAGDCRRGHRMKRRDFIAALGGAAAWPFAARAQQARVPLIGFIGTTSPSVWSQQVAAFEQRLSELGWIPGRTITIDYRWTEGRNEEAPAIAEAFVQRKVDIIVAGGNAVAAARRATTSIPIVFPVAVDPVGSGFVDSLSRPGGNVTGLSLQGPDVAGKRLELLREIVPGRRRLAIMVNVGYVAAKQELAQVQIAAAALGFDSVVLEIRQAQDIAPAFDGLNDRADALYVVTEALVSSNAARINTLALGERMPTIFGTREGIQAGGLVCYGPNLSALFRRAAEFADKILRGAKPGDIPVEQPTKFELIVNLTTAKALGLTIPPNLLALADEVIE